MRVSRDKINQLSHVITAELAKHPEVTFIEDRNTIRLEARKAIEDLVKIEEKIDAEARRKIESQKRTILEGSSEWDVLYRKYYQDELKRLGS